MSRSPRLLSWVCTLAATGCFVDRGPGVEATTEVSTSGAASTSAPTTGGPGGSPTTGSTTVSTTVDQPTMGERTTGDGPTGPQVGGVCEEQCEVAMDCVRLDVDAPYTCLDGRCVDAGGKKSCSSDGQCQAAQSGWDLPCDLPMDCPCDGQMACEYEERCIDIGGGEGRCASLVMEGAPCVDGLAVTQMPLLDIPGSVTVCGSVLFACDQGGCRDFCYDDEGCAKKMPGHPVCVAQTGVCACTSDAQCEASGLPGRVVCRDGRCGCADDGDC